MKKIMLLMSFFITFGIYSCNEDEKNQNETENKTNSVQARNTNDSLNQEYKIVYDNRVLEVLLEKRQANYKNVFSYKKDGQLIFTLDYSFNNEEEGWKYDEQAKAITFANELKDLNIGRVELEKLNYILDKGLKELLFLVDQNNCNEDLYSILAYLKSATASNLRMINENKSQIEGTISPSFLVGKSFFIFQEDFIVDLNILRSNIDLLEAEAINTGWQQDINLVNFIRNSTQSSVTFDVLYSFYITKSAFKQHISDKVAFKKGDCSESCRIGCGSDWGCCMNYTGCCYYSSMACLMHDLACTECAHWYCGPGCKPDGPEGNRVVKVIMAPV